MPDLRRRHDVVVVGARAAGAATALLLARQGHDVVLVDRAEFPADTVSTHQIARPGVALLNRWGLLTAVLALAAWQGRLGDNLWWGGWTIGPAILHPLSLLFVLSGSLMISKTLRIPKI